MKQSYVGITLDIIDYEPKDFDFSSCSFIFISEEHNFEREISFMNANQICQKIPIAGRKEIKYSIKVLKDDNLIGITDFIIPYQIIFKKEKMFDKICPINMKDSTKKLIIGDLNNNIALKIGIHANLQYLEENKSGNISNNKKENKQFFHKKKINNKKERLKIFSPSSKTEKHFPIRTNSSSSYKNKFNINTHNIKNYGIINPHHYKADSFVLEKNSKRPKIEKHKRTFSSQKQENEISKIKKVKNKILETKEIKQENLTINNEISDININNNIEENDVNKKDLNKLNNDFDLYINEKKEKINEIDNINEMINFTINNIKNIEDYRENNYNLIKEKINSINNLNEQYIKVNEQLKDNLSKKNKLIEKIQDYETQIELLTNKEKAIELQNKEFFELKLNELDIIKNLSYLKHDNNNYNKNIKDNNEQLLLLLKILKLISKRHGHLQDLLTQTNSIESQRITLKNIITKYKSDLEFKENS